MHRFPFVLPVLLSAVLITALSSCGRSQSTTKEVAGHILVKIPVRDFYMGKTEVTQAQWEAVMGDNPSHLTGKDKPVEQAFGFRLCAKKR